MFFTVVALTGLSSLMASIIPIEAGMAIVLWIGIIITAQAFSAVPRVHAPAVAIGLFPAVAAFGVLVLTSAATAAGIAAGDPGLGQKFLDGRAAFQAAGLHVGGLAAISQGFMLTCLVWSAMTVNLIERRFMPAALWAAVGGVAAFFGFIHAGRLTPSGGSYDIGWATGVPWAIGYALCALFIALIGRWAIHTGQTTPPSPDDEASH